MMYMNGPGCRSLRRRARPVSQDAEKMPLTGDALQHVRAVIGEFDPRARDEIFDRVRDHGFARPRVRHDSRADMNCDAGDLVARDFTLPGVHPGPQLEPERANGTTHLRGAANR